MRRGQYVSRLLALYSQLPDTAATVRTADRNLAARLFNDGVPLDLACAALRVAISRRHARPPDAPPLQPIRSLHYFLPVIQEAKNLPKDYLAFICRAGSSTADHDHDGCELRKQPESRGS